MEEFGQEEIQLYCNDVLDSSLALVESALHTSKVEFTIYNQEQFVNIQVIIDDIFENLTYYYYAYGDNYLKHPCYKKEYDEIAEFDAPPYMLNHFRNNAKSYYTFLLTTNKEVTNSNIMFEVKYHKKSETTIHISFLITEKEKVRQTLSEYLYRYRCDEVYNEYENVLDYKTQKKLLYELLTENNYNYNNFHVTDVKYIKSILASESEGQIMIHNTYIGFDNNELSCRCIISDDNFIDLYKKTYQDSSISLNNKLDNTASLAAIKKLTDIEVKIISARAYLEENFPERVTYRKIAEFLSDNNIYKITENNIKQKVICIYNKLGKPDLAYAVMLLRDANRLITFEDLDK